MWLEGDSTVQAFRCDARRVESHFTGLEQAGTVKVLVASLDCANPRMNGHLQQALKMRQHPEIALRVKSIQLGPRNGDHLKVTTFAELTLSGQTRSIVIDGEARQTETGLAMTGRHRLRMTDFGVKPPTLMLGVVKVKDDVTVGFEFSIPQPGRHDDGPRGGGLRDSAAAAL